MPHDSLGDRMKEYENAYRFYLPRRMPVIVRVDGKAFHTFTRGFKRPFDSAVSEPMKEVAIELCRNVEGCKLAYTQSDEISLVLRNDDELTTQAWFGNNLQKIASVTASIATRAFNRSYRSYVQQHHYLPLSLEFMSDEKQEKFKKDYNTYFRNIDQAMFDSRAFLLPEHEVVNYFIWRQQDAVRNSVESCARSMYSHKELHKKNCAQMLQMMKEKGFDWHGLPMNQKAGLCIVKRSHEVNGAQRSKWTPDLNIPIFSEARDYIIDEVWGKHEQV